MAKKRQIKKTIAIVGEGQTEKIYFNNFKKHNKKLSIKIKPELAQHSNLESLYKKAKRLEKDNYDLVFCVFDTDTILNNSKEEAKYNKIKKEVKNTNINLIESYPCFELWFLLHYEYSTREYAKCNETIKNLKKHIKDYNKSETDLEKKELFKFLEPKLEEAIENAQKLNKAKTLSKTEVYKFFTEIEKYK